MKNKIYYVNDNAEGDGTFSVYRTPWFGYKKVIAYDEYEKIKHNYHWLIKHSWMSGSISKAKAAELIGCSLIDFDNVIGEVK